MGDDVVWSLTDEFESVRKEYEKICDKMADLGLPFVCMVAIENDGERTSFHIRGHMEAERTPVMLMFFKMLLDNDEISHFLIDNFHVILAALKTGHALADQLDLPEVDFEKLGALLQTDNDGEDNVELPGNIDDFLNGLLNKDNKK
jgi:hypothetical protein